MYLMLLESIFTKWVSGSQLSRRLAIRALHQECSKKPSQIDQSSFREDDNVYCTCSGVYQNGSTYEMTPFTKDNDQKCKGLISQHINRMWGRMALGKAYPFTYNDRVFGLVNVGPKNAGYNKEENLDQGRENVRESMGAVSNMLNNYAQENFEYDACNAGDASAEGIKLSDHYGHYVAAAMSEVPRAARTKPVFKYSPQIELGRSKAMAQNIARTVSETPPNLATPGGFASYAHYEMGGSVNMQVLEREWIVKQGMEGFLRVANSSSMPPLFLEMNYNGAGEGKPSVLITATGVTFESGGLSLLPTRAMAQPVGMAGAAVAVATLSGLANLQVKVNVNCVIPLCENLVSGHCLKVGEVVKVGNKVIQMDRTDLDGHLMAADALVYAQEKYKPKIVLNLASFSRVEDVTDGGPFSCFTNSDMLWRRMQAAGAVSGDRPWRQPVWDYYEKQLTNNFSGVLKISSTEKASACIGASLIKNFMHGDWMHLDIAGVTWINPLSWGPSYLNPVYPTGRPTRTLLEFFLALDHDCTDCPL